MSLSEFGGDCPPKVEPNRSRRSDCRQSKRPTWKRGLDLSLLLLASPAIVPLCLLVSLWVGLTSGLPLVFRQRRIGINGEEFTMFKFRTMGQQVPTDVHEKHLEKLVSSEAPLTKLDAVGDPRLLPGAGLIRAFGLDELPQVLNILRGEMSLVGPRPCTVSEYPLFDEEQRARFEGLPGVTGYWQVQGKNNTTFREMVEMDIKYLHKCSLPLDLAILLRTPWAVVAPLAQCVMSRLGRHTPDTRP